MEEGERLRDEGIRRVARGNGQWLENTRQWARDWARAHGQVSSDDLRRHLTLPDGAHDNLWGAVFKGRNLGLIPVGRTRNHTATAHARDVRVWVLGDPATGIPVEA